MQSEINTGLLETDRCLTSHWLIWTEKTLQKGKTHLDRDNIAIGENQEMSEFQNKWNLRRHFTSKMGEVLYLWFVEIFSQCEDKGIFVQTSK